jgi:hypothetical protein
LPRVSIILISGIKFWAMIFRLCMRNGQRNYVNVLDSKSGCKTVSTFGVFLPVTVQWHRTTIIRNTMCAQNLSEWCHWCQKMSSQCPWRIDFNDNRHASFIHVSNCITLRTHLLPMAEIFYIACGTSWKSRRRRWIRNGEEVQLHLPKTSEMIDTSSIISWKCRNVIRPCHFSLR